MLGDRVDGVSPEDKRSSRPTWSTTSQEDANPKDGERRTKD